ncbi:PAC2 family protein [Microbacterium esteraromaticum]|uniref:proteasome assembly chaperone family protein n=1 Tax=Microbacterium esteraromaticum TaxID=57043 RepID=UPI002368E6ED|nr:PAC2 family protein [Microbacterium esteraromaticum]WDH77519.1 PAC2 family protein [Microbacterium esteraromaticum]
MPSSADLYESIAGAPDVPTGLPLVILLTGFTDAGSAVSGLIEHLDATAEPRPVIRFDNDELLDYRARRPVIVFDQDHLTEYRPAKLELSLAHDALGQPFLLLSGYEPDFAWNAFTEAVIDFVDAFQVSTVSWVHSIAMPVPHTRPLGATVSGNRHDLIAAHSVWRPRTQVPGTAGHLLEYRLIEHEHRVAGFVLLVPHYLADTEYPDTVLAAADKVMIGAGLVLRMDDVQQQREEFLARVGEQVEGSEELTQMVHTLEGRYDAYMAGREDEAEESFNERDLPSADELAAELERYLADRRPGDDDKR